MGKEHEIVSVAVLHFTDRSTLPERTVTVALIREIMIQIIQIPTKVILHGLKRNMSRSDELDLSSVLGDTRAYLHSLVLG